jgi:rubrerythrin
VVDDLGHDLGLLRAVLARELATINHYRSLAGRAAEGPAREFLEHITEEEKLHVADILQAIARLDADQARLLSAGFAPDHAPGDIPALRAEESPLPEPSTVVRETSTRAAAATQELTVGSLRRVPQAP